jgi:ribosome-associated toxin RatA of RatAB toxin-antitoxin module
VAVHEEVVLDGEPRAVYDVVTDYEGYPRFFPEFRQATILDRDGGALVVEFTADYGKELSYTLRIEHDEARLATHWTYVGGDLKDSRGGWRFLDAGGGRTRAVYDLDVQVGFLVPKMIVQKLTRMNVPRMFDQLRAEVARRKREGG